MADSPQPYYQDDGLQVYHEPSDDTSSLSKPRYPSPTHHGSSEKANAVLGLTRLPQAHYDQSRKHAQILGLPRQSFWLLIVLIVVIIAAAVGGGVGGTLAVQRARSQSKSNPEQEPHASGSPSSMATATPTTKSPSSTNVALATTTPYIPIQPALVTLIDESCPPNLVAYNGSTFSCSENRDFKGGFNITGLIAYSLQACIDACVTYNAMDINEFTCRSVVLAADMATSYAQNSGANCWLKGGAVDGGELVEAANRTVAGSVRGVECVDGACGGGRE